MEANSPTAYCKIASIKAKISVLHHSDGECGWSDSWEFKDKLDGLRP